MLLKRIRVILTREKSLFIMNPETKHGKKVCSTHYVVLFRTRILRVLLGTMFLVGLVGTAIPVDAGFGITPPYVKNDRLTRGTTYDQRIYLVRSDPEEDLKVQVTMNIPEAEAWFSVDQGTEFMMPRGMTQLPIVISVHVPSNAAYKKYTGAIRIRTSSANLGALFPPTSVSKWRATSRHYSFH